jgi:hypothetical protein
MLLAGGNSTTRKHVLTLKQLPVRKTAIKYGIEPIVPWLRGSVDSIIAAPAVCATSEEVLVNNQSA